jgi:hypothetical protein
MIDHYAMELAKKCIASNSNSSTNAAEFANREWQQVVASLFRSILLREPSDPELERSIAYIRGQSAGNKDLADPLSSLAAWADLIKALLSTNEFCFID